MIAALAAVRLFSGAGFAESEYGSLHRDSLILNQGYRAETTSIGRRKSTSNAFRPKEFWKEWDNHWEQARDDGDYPLEWDIAIRPIIARLYKEGMIQSHHDHQCPGRAMAVAEEPGHARDLFIDYRVMLPDLKFPRGVNHPPPQSDLLKMARLFRVSHPRARFGLLRLWSAPHFWPLMVGIERRDQTSFTDPIGRAWQWNFMPKDFPNSETSMHHNACSRIEPFKKQLGDRVFVMRDLYLVMGVDAGDLEWYATAVMFAIQTEPWRMEVALWRSFINVNLEFLEGMKQEWLE